MTVRRFILAAWVLSLSAVATVLLGADPLEDQKAPELEKRLQELLDERVVTAKRAVDAMQAPFDAQTITLFDLLGAINKLAEARLSVAQTSAQKIDALEKRLKQVQQVEEKVAVLYQIGTRGGEAKEYATVQRERQSAEIAYIRAILEQKR